MHTEADWSIRLFGRLELATASGEIARFRSRTALSLLAYLCLYKPREIANHTLQETFWPDSEGDRQAQNLRRAICDLRIVLERDLPRGSVIVTRKGFVSVNSLRVETDIEKFLDLTRPDEEDTSKLSAGIKLYEGALLAPISDSWVMGRRMEFEERFGQAVARLCELLVEQGNAQDAVRVGRTAVVAAPSREDVHVALVKSYSAAGMSVEALRQFEELERVLDETWGERPSAKAREALEAAFSDDVPKRNNLPEQLTSFIGREKEIEELCALLANTRLLTLTGSGGCGKTRLSLKVASRSLDQFRDGVWFVELAPLSDPELVPSTIATALDITEQPGKTIEQTLIQRLKSQRMLLILDNCEHLLFASAQLAETILRQCPSVVIMATSREALSIGGESIYRVPSLSMPDPKVQPTVENLSGCESVQLFLTRATQAQREFLATDQNAAALVSVCRRLDGIPLAIELAAARMRSMSIEELSERLDDRFRLLTGGSRTALPRQQTLRSLIEWSYNLLNDAEKALFGRLAVFSGGWTLDSAEKVCSGDAVERTTILELLTSLSDKNLVVAEKENGATRYSMLETIRYYSRDRLLEGGQAKSWRDRHLSHFLATAEEAEPALRGPEQVKWLDLLEAEHDNLRTALKWSISNGGTAHQGLRLAGALCQLWERRGHLTEGRSSLNTMLSKNPLPEVSIARAKAFSAAARLAQIQSDQDSARLLCEESIRLYRQLGDQYGLAESLNTLGNVTMEQGDSEAAKPIYRESLAIRQELGDALGIAQSMANLAVADFCQGDYDSARERAERSLSIRRELGDHLAVAVSLSMVAHVAMNQGDWSSARELAKESLDMNRQIGNQRGGGVALLRLAEVEWHCSDLPAARRAVKESLAIFQELGLGLGSANALELLGLLDSEEGDHTSAIAHYRESLKMGRDQTNPETIACALDGIANVFAELTSTVNAARLFGAAALLREKTGKPNIAFFLGTHQQRVASARAAMGDDQAFDRAWQEGREMTLEQAIELALSSDSP